MFSVEMPNKISSCMQFRPSELCQATEIAQKLAHFITPGHKLLNNRQEVNKLHIPSWVAHCFLTY